MTVQGPVKRQQPDGMSHGGGGGGLVGPARGRLIKVDEPQRQNVGTRARPPQVQDAFWEGLLSATVLRMLSLVPGHCPRAARLSATPGA